MEPQSADDRIELWKDNSLTPSLSADMSTDLVRPERGACGEDSFGMRGESAGFCGHSRSPTQRNGRARKKALSTSLILFSGSRYAIREPV